MGRLLHVTIATALIFGVVAVMNAIPWNFSFLDPLVLAFRDFEMTDLVYSQMNGNQHLRLDTNIVLVNIAELSRGDIAREIATIEASSPAVIGLDALFLSSDSSDETKHLAAILNSNSNVVVGTKLLYADSTEDDNDSVVAREGPLTGYKLENEAAYLNFNGGATEFRTLRRWKARSVVQNDTINSFAYALAKRYQEFIGVRSTSRLNDDFKEVVINYQKSRTYARVDAEQVLRSEVKPAVFRSKIVILGFLGRSLTDSANVEDRFFTPLNENYVGKALPDMYGVEVHATCVSMFLHNDFVHEADSVVEVLISVLICWLTVLMFSYIAEHLPYFYDITTKSILVCESVLILLICVAVFYQWRWKIDITLALWTTILSADLFDIYDSAREAIHEHRKRKITYSKEIV